MIPRRRVKIKIFLSVVIPVVKTAFVPFSAIGENPANAGVARLCGVSPHPIPDTTTALPKQARYQLRYTRLFRYFIRLVVFSQTRRDTNFAIPGYSLFCHDTTASGKNKDFSVCGHSCGQSRFCAVFDNRGKSRKRRRRKAFRRFTLPRPGYSHGTPKASALPTALHPDTVFTLHRKSVFDSPNSILDFGRKVNRPVAYPARIAYNKNITQYIKERAL